MAITIHYAEHTFVVEDDSRAPIQIRDALRAGEPFVSFDHRTGRSSIIVGSAPIRIDYATSESVVYM